MIHFFYLFINNFFFKYIIFIFVFPRVDGGVFYTTYTLTPRIKKRETQTLLLLYAKKKLKSTASSDPFVSFIIRRFKPRSQENLIELLIDMIYNPFSSLIH